MGLAQQLAIEEASKILGRHVAYFRKRPSAGESIKCGNTELQHVCMAKTCMPLDHRAQFDRAIAYVCKDLDTLCLSLANVTHIFSHFLQSMATTWRASFGKFWERINGPIGQTSTSWSGVRIRGRSGGLISQMSSCWSRVRISWSGGIVCLKSGKKCGIFSQTITSCSGVRISRKVGRSVWGV